MPCWGGASGLAFARCLNVTVLPEFAQSEGVAAVLDNLVERARVTAVTTSPYVMELSDAPDAGREPPVDADAGKVRLLDRDLFGKRAVTVRTSPSFVPDRSYYEGLRYQPQPPDALTARAGERVAELIAGAKARDIKTYLQVQAAIPPGYRVQFGGPEPDDRCRLPEGDELEGRVDKNGSLASPHIKDYGCALIRDLVRAYPNVDGLRVDWSEFPPYAFDSLFFDFSGHAKAAAERLGYDFEMMSRDALRLRRFLFNEMNDGHLNLLLADDTKCLWDWLGTFPGVLALRRFKSDLVVELIDAYGATVDDASGGRMEFLVQGFPPPWAQASGFDVTRLAPLCSGIGVKLYTMHWPMMVRAYADRLLGANANLSPRPLLAAIFRLLDLLDEAPPTDLHEVVYPEPDVPHTAGPKAQAGKIRETAALAGDTPVYAFSHAYGPLDDFRTRMETAWRASRGRMVVNRYGYMDDAKLDALGELTAEVAV